MQDFFEVPEYFPALAFIQPWDIFHKYKIGCYFADKSAEGKQQAFSFVFSFILLIYIRERLAWRASRHKQIIIFYVQSFQNLFFRQICYILSIVLCAVVIFFICFLNFGVVVVTFFYRDPRIY